MHGRSDNIQSFSFDGLFSFREEVGERVQSPCVAIDFYIILWHGPGLTRRVHVMVGILCLSSAQHGQTESQVSFCSQSNAHRHTVQPEGCCMHHSFMYYLTTGLIRVRSVSAVTLCGVWLKEKSGLQGYLCFAQRECRHGLCGRTR